MTIFLLAVTIAGLVFTLLTLRAAISDRRALIDAGKNGIRSAFARQQIRHELLRLVKHILAVFIVFITMLDITHLIAWRNAMLVIVSALLTINSGLDLRDRRRDLRKLAMNEAKTRAAVAVQRIAESKSIK